MTLKQQLLLVSLLTLALPWAGCEFIRETESALRSGQQQLLAGTTRALASSLSAYVEEYPVLDEDYQASEQIFIHSLGKAAEIDGYFEDWLLPNAAQRTIRGPDGNSRMAIAANGRSIFVYVDVADHNPVYATAETVALGDGPRYADRVTLVSSNPPYLEERFVFAAEAPGRIVSYKHDSFGFAPEPRIDAIWQDAPGGYRLEARIPAELLGTHLGIEIANTGSEQQRPVQAASYSGATPPPAVTTSSVLQEVAANLAQTGTRIIVTDASGWRIAMAGQLSTRAAGNSLSAGWSNRIYDFIVEGGRAAETARPDPAGRERRPYVSAALAGQETPSWFRSTADGRAIVAVAAPIRNDADVIGAVVLQQGTDAILSSTNEGLARLINVTLIATFVVAGILLGYATWLSRRIRRLSVAAENAMLTEKLQVALPSALSGDEIGDLSRSFSTVLRQLGDYNEYLRSLASKLSHELRTPLAIVTSSLENLEHEPLNEASADYTKRARAGADRLRRILNAMSEANRVEELIQNIDLETFDLDRVVASATSAYADVYPQRRFAFDAPAAGAKVTGSPELLIQMLDKLVDNAVDFSGDDDEIEIGLDHQDDGITLSVTNPGPALPKRMQSQIFDSMVSIGRSEKSQHLGLGLYIARLIAEGHGGHLAAENTATGVRFQAWLPSIDSR